MIKLGREPEGLLLRRADVMAWLSGMSREEWRKLRATLDPVKLPGSQRPYFRKSEIHAKLISKIT